MILTCTPSWHRTRAIAPGRNICLNCRKGCWWFWKLHSIVRKRNLFVFQYMLYTIFSVQTVYRLSLHVVYSLRMRCTRSTWCVLVVHDVYSLCMMCTRCAWCVLCVRCMCTLCTLCVLSVHAVYSLYMLCNVYNLHACCVLLLLLLLLLYACCVLSVHVVYSQCMLCTLRSCCVLSVQCACFELSNPAVYL